MITRLSRRVPNLVWAPIRFVPLLVGAAYLAVLHGPSPVDGADWGLGMLSATVTLAGGRLPLLVTVAQSALLVVAWSADSSLALAVTYVLAAVALGELWMRRSGLRCWLGAAAFVAAQAGVFAPKFDPVLTPSSILLTTAPPMLLGLYIRSVLQGAIAAKQRSAFVAQQARAAERAAIARELHDLVAHHMGSVAVRVGAARRALGERDPEVAQALSEVHTTARTALADLRQLVTTLRDPRTAVSDVGESLVDSASLPAALAGVVEQARSAGITLDAEISPEVAGLDAMRRLAVLRVVQEGLANVAKHAGPHASATLRVRVDDGQVGISIRDRGGDPPPVSRGGPGFGLTGMRERIELLGGTVTAGATGAGWELTATMPKEERR
ncbi:sensor histidine kinase [Amycolatopsis sp. ATCC 39116]|uniref:sensor histidine kinase n=1 Tax=Amycolatopsis sp. (strain ATCC 39116 / 75iv2) TaxID=385957 RepID=UPI0002626CCB|nr:histidine kinase [Amycolatopsis sp. ATCC 39116]